jgi:DNA-binding NarL/FixJ family response regulator
MALGESDIRPPRVVVLEDGAIPRAGLVLLIQRRGLEVAHTGGSLDARSILADAGDDVALLGPGLAHRASLVRARLRDDPLARLVVCCAPESAAVAAALGAAGVVLTSSEPHVLTDALTLVAAGDRYRDPGLGAAVAAVAAVADAAVGDATVAGVPGTASRPKAGGLTPREREVMALLGDGCNGPEIAERLYISTETVRTHIAHAVTKLGARTRVHAVAMLAREAAGGLPGGAPS